mmetsp:Transcript_2055/g.2939  ORF Transcript_2055/g.2939 Transcript_2055/m.2939 type:complete len:128 (+) Transcript_2055:183-566(+)
MYPGPWDVSLSYNPSRRAKCRWTNKIIPRKALRVGFPKRNGTKWYDAYYSFEEAVEALKEGKLFRHYFDPLSNVRGFQSLRTSDQSLVKELLCVGSDEKLVERSTSGDVKNAYDTGCELELTYIYCT